ncbi:MAG TPA: glycosyltransferase [Streptosporangiaceae bacterium]|jgi:MGT family glycosyltransferase
MSRFLFVPLPLAGHVFPADAVAQELAARGHDVRWVGAEKKLRSWIGPGPVIYPTGMRPYRGQGDIKLASVRSLWAEFVLPFTKFTLPAVEKAVQASQPDVVVVDQHAFAGALVAERHGLPWATMASSSMELTHPYAHMPKVDAWIRGHQETLRAAARLPAGSASPDLRFSPYLVIAFLSAAFTGDYPFPAHYALVGPSLAPRPEKPGFPWDWLDPARRHVLVTVGTMAESNASGSGDFYVRAVQALRPLRDQVQGILIAPAGEVPDPPENVLVMPRVPLLDLMTRLDLVVCHGGQNTVCETLSRGVPLVIAPLTRDQPINAQRVADLGAGLRVRFGRVTPAQLREAILTILRDRSYRAAAERIRDSFTEAGGAAAAAARLESLARQPALAGAPAHPSASAPPATHRPAGSLL